jgi:hypothetical protein
VCSECGIWVLRLASVLFWHIVQANNTSTSIAGGAMAPAVVPENGFIATLKLTALRDVVEGTTIRLSPATSIVDPYTFERISFDIRGAVIVFGR